MITKSDLTVIEHEGCRVYGDDLVKYGDDVYSVGFMNVNMDEDAGLEELSVSYPDRLLALMFGIIPAVDTWVIPMVWSPADKEYVVKNECGDHCATGVCNKRVASDRNNGSLDLGYSLLLDFLNA